MKALCLSRRFQIIVTSAFLALLMLAVAILIPPTVSTAASDDESQPTKRTINVSGQGNVQVSPDIAYVSLGVVTENSDAKTAQQDNAAAMDAIVAAIKASGISKDDIRTTNYSIYPKYDYNDKTGTSNIVGYSVNNTIQVTVKDILKTGSVIDLAADKGANISSSISFGLSDYEKYYNEALKSAVEAAKKRAETMADVIGIKLGVPVTVSESGGYPPSYRVYDSISYAKVAEAGAPTPVSAGTIEVSANISMSYEY